MATVLLVERMTTRGHTSTQLRLEGYDVLVAVDEASALDWLAAGRVSADLSSSTSSANDGRRARRRRRVRERNGPNGATPLVVIAEQYGEELEGRDVSESPESG